MNDLLAAVQNRQSFGKLCEPAPNNAEIEQLLKTAVTVPDHGNLKPFRFIVVSGEGQTKLGAAFAQAMKRQNPEAPDAKIEKARAKAHAAPLMILIVSSPKESKIPLWEQEATAACTGYAISLAADLMGYGAIWKSIGIEIDTEVRQVLKMSSHENLLGWVNVGTRKVEKTGERQPIDLQSYYSQI